MQKERKQNKKIKGLGVQKVTRDARLIKQTEPV